MPRDPDQIDLFASLAGKDTVQERVGQRYGWVPEPRQFCDTTDRQRQEREPHSITDLEVRHAVSNKRCCD